MLIKGIFSIFRLNFGFSIFGTAFLSWLVLTLKYIIAIIVTLSSILGTNSLRSFMWANRFYLSLLILILMNLFICWRTRLLIGRRIRPIIWFSTYLRIFRLQRYTFIWFSFIFRLNFTNSTDIITFSLYDLCVRRILRFN